MGIFGSLLGGKKKPSSGFSPEVTRIFEKISEFMGDENLQNSKYAPTIRDRIVGGLDVDRLPHATGEFGRVAENPVPVNGVLGELIYLSLLKTRDTSQRLLFHRLGSVESIDVYETVSIDGRKWDILFLSLYHPRKSRKAPAGYVLAEPHSQPLLYGTNLWIERFPYGLQDAIRQTTEEKIGIPLRPPQVRQAEESVRFQRPQEHEEQIKIALAHVQSIAF